MIKRLKIFLKTFPLEGYFWVTALLILTIFNTELSHFTLCPFNNLGIDFCPGCGLGRSIHHFIHLDFTKSFNLHPFGGAAFLILVYRIFTLAKKSTRFSISKLSY